MIDGKGFLAKLKTPVKVWGYGYNLKGGGHLSYHLGCDYGQDEDGTLIFQLKKYMTKVMETYERIFGEKPKSFSSPLEKVTTWS